MNRRPFGIRCKSDSLALSQRRGWKVESTPRRKHAADSTPAFAGLLLRGYTNPYRHLSLSRVHLHFILVLILLSRLTNVEILENSYHSAEIKLHLCSRYVIAKIEKPRDFLSAQNPLNKNIIIQKLLYMYCNFIYMSPKVYYLSIIITSIYNDSSYLFVKERENLLQLFNFIVTRKSRKIQSD